MSITNEKDIVRRCSPVICDICNKLYCKSYINKHMKTHRQRINYGYADMRAGVFFHRVSEWIIKITRVGGPVRTRWVPLWVPNLRR